MRFVNETGCAAGLLRADAGDGFLRNALVARLRCGYAGGALHALPAEAQRATLRREAELLGGVGVAPDGFFPRSGCDVMVLGDATPEGGPCEAMRVRVEAGPYDVSARVTGDRVWERAGGSLVPSRPTPFTAMPVDWTRAFGGRAAGPHGPVPYADNPAGRGFYLDAAEAVGAPLPNVEFEGAPVRAWDDRPRALAFGPCPAESALRVESAYSCEGGVAAVHPERGLFDQAHPLLAGRELAPGARVRVTGLSPGAPIAFEVPLCPVEAELRFDALCHVRALALEEVVIDARAGVVELCWRYSFRYARTRGQRRVAVLRPCEG